MFGYVRPFKPQMRFCEFDAYKSVYCALCKELGHAYGLVARMTLSYDGTFVALVSAALSEEKATLCAGRCVCNPFKKCNYYCGKDQGIAYAAAVNVLLSAASCRDTVADGKGIKKWFARVMLLLLRRAERKAAAALPKTAQCIATQMTAQRAYEQAQCAVPDQAAEPTALMLAHILAHLAKDEEERRILDVIGYQLGRWVYLADALDDLDDDLRKQQYNPLALRFGLTQSATTQQREEATAYAKEILCANEARIAGAYELLRLNRLQPVLNNLIYEGLAAVRKALPRGKKRTKQEEQHERSI